jgi:flagellar motor switch protein FliM
MSENAVTILGSNAAPGTVPKVKLYDFKRPDKFSKEQIISLSIIHETLSQKFSVSLTSLLSTKCTTKVEMVDQLTFQEFMDSVEAHGQFSILAMTPIRGSSLLHLPQDFATFALERMAGTGSGIRMEELNRPFFDLESRVFSPFVQNYATQLKASWAAVLDLNPELVGIESEKAYAQIVPPTEMIIQVQCSAHVEDQNFSYNIIYPYLTLEPVLERLSAKYMYDHHRRSGKGPNPQISKGLRLESKLQMQLQDMTIKELRSLQPGSRIAIGEKDFGRLLLSSGGEILARGRWQEAQEGTPISLLLEHDDEQLFDEDQINKRMDRGFESILSSLRTELQRMHQPAEEHGPETDNFETLDNSFVLEELSLEHSEYLANLLGDYHPQIQAVFLTQVSNTLAADYVSRLSDEMQGKVLRRIGLMSSNRKSVLDTLAAFIDAKLRDFNNPVKLHQGGIEKAVEILNVSPAAVERQVIEGWDQIDPEFSEEIKKRMFVFEDIVLLDLKAVKKLIQQVQIDELALACKRIAGEVKQHLLSAMDDQERNALEQQESELGPVRLKDVDLMRQKMVQTIRDLEEAGEILVARPGEVLE